MRPFLSAADASGPCQNRQWFTCSERDNRPYVGEADEQDAAVTSRRTLNEFKATSFYFPDLKQAIDKVERVFADKGDLRRAIMLAAAYEILERLIA